MLDDLALALQWGRIIDLRDEIHASAYHNRSAVGLLPLDRFVVA
jgi:hypothetical protein